MTTQLVSVCSSKCQLVLDVSGGRRPRIVYWGAALKHANFEELGLLGQRQWAYGGAGIDIASSLSNELGAGNIGPSGFLAHRQGKDWAAFFKTIEVNQISKHQVRIECVDENLDLRVVYDVSIHPDSHVMEASTEVINQGKSQLEIDWCSALCIPLDQRFDRLLGFSGRWAYEFAQEEVDFFRGSYLRENKNGRTSHDNFPGLIAKTGFTSEENGLAAGFHLGWSGNSRVRADRNSDQRAFVQMGELFFPGEMQLAPQESYKTPVLYAAWSEEGLNGLSHQFHEHVRGKVLDGRIRGKARPVHYNTWEAVYFDHSEEKLIAIAEKAAEMGVERFVLDDGWFGSRRSDKSGLGDWFVSADIYARGLQPLADKVRDLGMEFGIWFEPEMVNPDSDLFRKHPDWVLEAPGVEQIPFRDQYVLDLTKDDVFQYLFNTISDIVKTLNVAYVKWDMNRDIHHPGSAGRGAIHKQTLAVYALMQKLRTTHPELEIESCASGGGRTDYGVLQQTDRIWTSDSNDALDRQRIQHGASYFFPLDVIGAHVGPKNCHITGRVYSIEYRAATALFGHMGLELNLLAEPKEDLETLKTAISLYKTHRETLHTGDFYRIESQEYLNVVSVVRKDKSEALLSCAKVMQHTTSLPERVRFVGLDASKSYRVKIVWPTANISITSPSIVEHADFLGEGYVFSGEALMRQGLQLPVTYPDICLLFHIKSEN
ncbi:alpha-galactosidase [Hirschia litorea]|uniref:alpha-galactosidase n=1 Tax=Hirschia litorea TaxID=1199156 RepID=A0ABW2IPM5_9PROT